MEDRRWVISTDGGAFPVGGPDGQEFSDGGRFVIVKAEGPDVSVRTQVNIVLNGFEELKRLVPTE